MKMFLSNLYGYEKVVHGIVSTHQKFQTPFLPVPDREYKQGLGLHFFSIISLLFLFSIPITKIVMLKFSIIVLTYKWIP